jgi:hypothetical protein
MSGEASRILAKYRVALSMLVENTLNRAELDFTGIPSVVK